MSISTAVSSPSGTTLPRHGFFPGVNPPHYQAIVVATELTGNQTDTMTKVSVPASIEDSNQTTPLSLPHIGFLLDSLTQTGQIFIEADDFAHAVVRGWSCTDSPWQSFRRTLTPLRSTPDALDEDVRDTLQSKRIPDVRAQHSGLAAVSRLIDILGLSRPTILRMGGVPQSTFYAWQSNPYATIRTPTISRLLRLQAQIAILVEALGVEKTRSWVLSVAHFDQLQGTEPEFTQALAEAADALAESIKVRPRPRMRRTDYTASLEADDSSSTP